MSENRTHYSNIIKDHDDRQGHMRFVATVYASTLAGLYNVPRRWKEGPDGQMEVDHLGYQRGVRKAAIEAIKAQVESGVPVHGAIILSFREAMRPKWNRKSRQLAFDVVPGGAAVVDGQHRLLGVLSALGTKGAATKVTVQIHIGLTIQEEARLFLDINKTAKPVSGPALAYAQKTAGLRSRSEQNTDTLYKQLFGAEGPLHTVAYAGARKAGTINVAQHARAARGSLGDTGPLSHISLDRRFEILRGYVTTVADTIKDRDQLGIIAFYNAIFDVFPMIAGQASQLHGDLGDNINNRARSAFRDFDLEEVGDRRPRKRVAETLTQRLMAPAAAIAASA